MTSPKEIRSESQQQRINSVSTLFRITIGAMGFQVQPQVLSAVTCIRQLFKRYSWLEVVRNEVAAWLLALNVKRHTDGPALDKQICHGFRGNPRNKLSSKVFVAPYLYHTTRDEARVNLLKAEIMQVELRR